MILRGRIRMSLLCNGNNLLIGFKNIKNVFLSHFISFFTRSDTN